jgi:Tfp pilus assembly protein PilF
MEDNKLSPAIQLAKAGHKKEARQLLETILKEDSNNTTAWLWMSDVAKDNQEKKTFLK